MKNSFIVAEKMIHDWSIQVSIVTAVICPL